MVFDDTPEFLLGYCWLFDGDVDVDDFATLAAFFEVEDSTNPGNFIAPFNIFQTANNRIVGQYANAPVPGLMWRMLTQPTGLASIVNVPQSGVTT